MKARLWFLHRGVEKLFEGRPADAAVELAEKISGDTSVAHALAFVLAVEQAQGVQVAPRDQALRAMLVEVERIYNHVNDIGAMVNDVGYGIVHAHTQRLREMELLTRAFHSRHTMGVLISVLRITLTLLTGGQITFDQILADHTFGIKARDDGGQWERLAIFTQLGEKPILP